MLEQQNSIKSFKVLPTTPRTTTSPRTTMERERTMDKELSTAATGDRQQPAPLCGT